MNELIVWHLLAPIPLFRNITRQFNPKSSGDIIEPYARDCVETVPTLNKVNDALNNTAAVVSKQTLRLCVTAIQLAFM